MKLKRLSCLLLSVFLVISCPLYAYADATTTIAWTAGRYAFSLLLNACGVDVGLSGMSAWLGQWSGMDDYNIQGSSGKLGSFSQYLYNLSHNAATEAARERALADQQKLNDLMLTGWGGTVDVGGLLDTLKDWLGTMSSYGTDSTDYKGVLIPSVGINDILVPDDTVDLSGYTFGFKVALKTGVVAYYFDCPLSDIYLYHAGGITGSQGVESYVCGFRRRLPSFTSQTVWATSVFCKLNNDGSITYSSSRVSSFTLYRDDIVGDITSILLSIPFPVFDPLSASNAFVESGSYDNAYNQSALKLPVVRVFPSAQNAVIATHDPVITLPGSESASEAALKDVTSATDLDALKQALIDAGLVIDWTPSTDVPTQSETDTSSVVLKLADILASIQAIPANIAKFFEDKTAQENTDENVKRLSLPDTIMNKFPFCIPFDVAYLVESMKATAQAPRFEIPIKFDYLTFHYNETFYVDMSQFDSVVRIFRVMLDLLFCAGLISVTRDLIRG